MLREFGDPLLGKRHALFAFEVERLGDNRHRQDTQLLSHFSHDRRCTGTGTAAHTCCDEDHVCPFQRRTQCFAIFFCRVTAHFRVRTRTQTFGNVITDLNGLADSCFTQRLRVGIHSKEFHTFDTLAYHVLYGVTAAATDADDFNHRVVG